MMGISELPMERYGKKSLTRVFLGAIVVLTVVLRVTAAFYLGDEVKILPGTADQLSYHTLAVRVLQGHGFSFGEPWWPLTAAGAPTAHWSYLYTFYLVFVYSVFGFHPLAARLLQAILVGVLRPYLVYWLGKRAFNPLTGLFAAVLSAIYPYFIYYDATLLTEPFYITAILASLWMVISFVDWIKGQNEARSGSQASDRLSAIYYGIGIGLCLAAAVLLRQLFLLFIPVLFAWLWLSGRIRRGQEPGQKQVPGMKKNLGLPIILSSAVILALILPFTIYNYSRFHRFVLLNTNAGFAFFWANHPIYGTHFIPILRPEMGTYLDLIPKELGRLDEAALDQALLGRGVKFILDDPKRFLLLSLSRIPVYFMFWPSSESDTISNISRVGGFGLLLPFFLYGIVRSFIPKPPVSRQSFASPVTLFLLFAFTYTIIHVLSWTLIRYRLPVDAILMIFAGLAFTDLTRRLGVGFAEGS